MLQVGESLAEEAQKREQRKSSLFEEQRGSKEEEEEGSEDEYMEPADALPTTS